MYLFKGRQGGNHLLGLIPGNSNYPGMPALTSVGGGGNGPHSGNSGSASPYDTGSGHGSGNPSPSPAVVRMLELANNGIGQVSPVGGHAYPNTASSPNANHMHVNTNQQQQMMSTSPNDSGGSPIPPTSSALQKDHHSIQGMHSNQHLNPLTSRGGGGEGIYSPMKTDNSRNHAGQPELLSPHHSSIGLSSMYGGVGSAQNHGGSSGGGLPPPPVSLAGDLAGNLGLPSGGPGGVPPDLRLSHPAITQWLQQAQQAQQAAAAAAVAAAGGGDSGRLGIGGASTHSPPWIKKDEPKDEPMDREQSPQSGASSDYANL